MADLNPSGQVQSADQIRADRIRKGLCETCRLDPGKSALVLFYLMNSCVQYEVFEI